LLKKKYIFITFLLVFYFINNLRVSADRGLPAKIEPIIYNNIKIAAENNTPDNMGIVQAFDVNTNKLLWSTRVYKVKIKNGIEEDTQWIFIREMKIENDTLIIINERNKVYELDPVTGKDLNKIYYISSKIILFSAVSVIIIRLIIKKIKSMNQHEISGQD